MSYSLIEDIDDIIGPNAMQVPKQMRQSNGPNLPSTFNMPPSPAQGQYNNIHNYHSYNPQDAMAMRDRNDVASKFYERQSRAQPRIHAHKSSVNNVEEIQDDFFNKPSVTDIMNVFREEEIRISDKKEKKEKREKKDETCDKEKVPNDLTNIDVINEIRRMSTVFTSLLQKHDDQVDMLRRKIEMIEMTQKGILFLLFIILLLILLKSNHVAK